MKRPSLVSGQANRLFDVLSGAAPPENIREKRVAISFMAALYGGPSIQKHMGDIFNRVGPQTATPYEVWLTECLAVAEALSNRWDVIERFERWMGDVEREDRRNNA